MTTIKEQEGDFSFIQDPMTRTAYEDMYAAITAANAWDEMKEDPGPSGFMWSTAPYVRRIHQALNDRVGHSGTSMAFTMRAMQQLARIGWSAFVAGYKN
jgi:RES domain-containing protein